MPIIVTPITTDPPEGTDCAAQDVVAPQITEVYGTPIPTKMQSITVSQGQTTTIEWTIRAPNCAEPVNLLSCGFVPASTTTDESSVSEESVSEEASPPEIVLKIRETMAINRGCADSTTITGTVIDAVSGQVQFPLTEQETSRAGIYVCEVAVRDGDGNNRFMNRFYLVIEPGQYGTITGSGMLTIAELRLHLRDSSPDENLLLDSIDFDVAEIAACMQAPVDYWNEIPPPLRKRYTTQTFPHRYHWLQGTIAQLFFLAAEHYRRNAYRANAGGMTVDDKNKFMEYSQEGDRRWKEFKTWAQSKKVSDNVSRGATSSGSVYGWH